MIYTIIASAFEGNKGASSMLEASVQYISKHDKEAQFYLLSVYPNEDERQNRFSNLTVLNGSPVNLVFVINLLAFLYLILPFTRSWLRKNNEINAIASSDVYLDQGGITFVDGRAKFLIYNVATILPALFMRKKVVKCSQALGPFETIPNKMTAKLILPKVEKIFARGKLTQQNLKVLNLDNVELKADLAFSLQVEKESKKKIDLIINKYKFDKSKQKVFIFPSQVVAKKCESRGIDYINQIAKFIDGVGSDFEVLLVPHSMRFGTEKLHNNDVILCKNIIKATKRKNTKLFDTEINASDMRYLVSRADIVFASRFHAMVSALASGVPLYVIGWSHKYQEVLDMFDIKEAATDLKFLDYKVLKNELTTISKNHKKIKNTIEKHLPSVRKSSESQLAEIIDIARSAN